MQDCSHFHKTSSRRALAIRLICFDGKTGSEQIRSSITAGLGDHDARDEHFLSLFQVL